MSLDKYKIYMKILVLKNIYNCSIWLFHLKSFCVKLPQIIYHYISLQNYIFFKIIMDEDKICKIILFLNDIYTLLVHNFFLNLSYYWNKGKKKYKKIVVHITSTAQLVETKP